MATTVAEISEKVVDRVGQVILGKDQEIRLCLVAMLCQGHLLIEDVPGTGKTLLAKALARSLDCSFRRIQFTPDLLPSDLTGSNAFNQKTSDFEFRPGPVFAQVVLADEINRASPRTQSALLEAMEESQVTIDGVTRELPRPFMVMATQNPVEYAGTFPLPEAQLDRFLIRVHLGYLTPETETQLLQGPAGDRLQDLVPVVDRDQLEAAAAEVREVHVEPGIARYIVDLVGALRVHPDLSLGASTRASVGLLHASRALAASLGRDHVLPDDVKSLARPVLAHRVQLRPSAEMRGLTTLEVVGDALRGLAVPQRRSSALERGAGRAG